MIKEKFNELKKEAIFIEENKRQKFGNPFITLCITDFNLNLEQIDFSYKKGDNIFCFSYKDGLWNLSISKEKRDYNNINIKKIKDIEELKDIIERNLKNKKLFPNKYIFILQNINGENIYSITCLCEEFYVYKIKIDAENLKVIDTSLHSLFDFFEIKK